ncbi:MAG: hypothetical protein AAGA75_14760 [Cyanobacteria bacterium P01_E01_bin.6]
MDTVLIERIKIALQSEIPESKYSQFQYVKQGQIVGACWYSLDYCWGQGIHPGWWYTVECGCDHQLIHEDDIRLVEGNK